MANYLTVALDVYGKKTAEFIEAISPGWTFYLESLSQELDTILESRGQNVTSLFHDIAIDCDAFIIFCQYHSSILANIRGDGSDNCCGINCS